MHFLILAPWNKDAPWGPATHLRYLVRGLTELGGDVQVYVPDHVGVTWLRLAVPSVLARLLAPFSRDFSHRVHRFLISVAHAFVFALIHARRKLDLVNIQHVVLCDYVSFVCKWLEIPLTLTVHGKHAEEVLTESSVVRSSAAYVAATQNERAAYQKADIIFAVSDQIKTHIASKYKVQTDRIVLLPNGLDPNDFAPPEQPLESLPIPELASLPSHTSKILFVGALSKIKGPDILLDAFRLVSERSDGKLMLVYVGQGEMYSELIQQALTYGIREQVVFIGEVSYSLMPTIYALADVVALPSVSIGEAEEGLPYAALEALASGKALVSTATGGLSKFLIDDFNSFLAVPSDAESLADKIVEALTCPRTDQIADEARRLVREELSYCRMVEDFWRYCERLLSARRTT